MSDPFQQALEETLPALEGLKFRKPKPTASLSALERLQSMPPPPKPVPAKISPPPETSVKESPPKPKVERPARTADPDVVTALSELREAALQCTKCPHLVKSRTQVVFGVGNPAAELFFVGEAPGADEDAQGEPFVGRAGQLLSKIIEAMGLTRQDIYIANVLKCRPDMPEGQSGNRKPKTGEMETCLPWLEKQIELIKPKTLVALGATATEGLLGKGGPMGELRGQWHEFRGIPTIVTYHPAYLLRNQSISEKRKVWEDMLLVLEKLGHPISAKQRSFFTSPNPAKPEPRVSGGVNG